MKSRAEQLLKKLREEDMVAEIPGGPGDVPDDKGAAAAADQPQDNQTMAPELKDLVGGFDEPAKVSEALDAMASQCDKFLGANEGEDGEEGDDMWHPKDDAEKAAIQESKMLMKKASEKMKAYKK